MNLLPIKRAHLFFLIIAWVTIFPSQALAYLDPGTGSLIVQTVIAGFVTVGFAIRLYWGRIRELFKRRVDDADPSTGPSGPSRSDS